jgi:hypothetical protein
MNEHICQLITTETEAQKLLDSSTKAYLDGTQEWMWVTTKQLNQMPTLQGGRHVFIYKAMVPANSSDRLQNVMALLRDLYSPTS